MALMRLGDHEGAARIAMSRNPMPAVTSRVCAHFCEGECNRRTTDQAVSVHEVERRLGDLIMGDPGRYYPPPEAETGKSVAVVGSGPAGLTAAYHLRRAGHSVTVYERMEKAGGCLRYAIPEYRLPRRIVDGLVDALSSMGIAFRTGAAVGPELPPGEIEARHDKTFYATGAWKRPVLGFDGEELTEFGLDFLTEVNTWVAKKDRDDVLVVGGGNVAMDVAVTVGAWQNSVPANMAASSREERSDRSSPSAAIAAARSFTLAPARDWRTARARGGGPASPEGAMPQAA